MAICRRLLRLSSAVALPALLVGIYSTRARADENPANKALATQLFQAGRALLAAGEVASACAKFSESNELDPEPGTYLNLAACHERQGLTATAWAEFNNALARAQRDGRGDRVALAAERISALRPKLSQLVVVVPHDSEVPGLVIKRDGELVPHSGWGLALPVDPGGHRIEASAPGLNGWSTLVELAADADSKTVTVPQLEPAISVARAVAPAAESRAPLATAPVRPVHAEPTVHGDASGRSAALVSAGAGLVGIGVGSAFGLVALAKNRKSDEQCPAGRCSTSGVRLNQQAKSSADLATVAFAVGGACLAVGTYLWISNHAGRAATAARLSTNVGPAGAGLAFDGSF